MKRLINHYIAYSSEYNGCRYAVYQGFCESESEFIAMCNEKGFDINELEVEEGKRNIRDEMGRPFDKKVWKDE